jgi:hypothetical protein
MLLFGHHRLQRPEDLGGKAAVNYQDKRNLTHSSV